MCASLASHWLVAPHIVARDNLKLWHSLGSGLYLVQWLCLTIVFYLRLRASSNLLALRGTGQGLWKANAGQTVDKLRGEWDDS